MPRGINFVEGREFRSDQPSGWYFGTWSTRDGSESKGNCFKPNVPVRKVAGPEAKRPSPPWGQAVAYWCALCNVLLPDRCLADHGL
ncbi:MAG: hypothetical protein PVJ09_04585 [Candidatus Woesebacteria bacterium]|jgi:hypothetical protein